MPFSAALTASLTEAAKAFTDQLCNPDYISIDSLLVPLEKIAKSTSLLAQTTKAVFEMQRLLVGAPQQITEHRGIGASESGAPEKIAALGQMLQLMQRNRIIEAQSSPAPADTSRYEGEEGTDKLLDAVPERKTA